MGGGGGSGGRWSDVVLDSLLRIRYPSVFCFTSQERNKHHYLPLQTIKLFLLNFRILLNLMLIVYAHEKLLFLPFLIKLNCKFN